MMLNIVAFVIIVGVISIWRWSMPIVFGSVLVWASYDGNWLAFPYVIVCAGEVASLRKFIQLPLAVDAIKQ